MISDKFFGRTSELARLAGLARHPTARLIVVRGRRRIGKTSLLREFGRSQQRTLFFSGLPPTPQQTAQSQREEFVAQMGRMGIPGVNPQDWGDLFWHVAHQTRQGPVLVVFDEIAWLGSKDPDFLGKLKNAWDLEFSQNPQCTLALCGSISSWIEENILTSTGFLGRITLDLVLEELPLAECALFWGKHRARIAAYEKLKVLSVTGGVPLYLEHIRPELSAEQNLQQLCFSPGGLLVREFDHLFSDLFAKKNAAYKAIVQSLATGAKELSHICEDLGKSEGGHYSQLVDDLTKTHLITRDSTWKLGSLPQESKLSRYRLSDNYLRFYLKYIGPYKNRIEAGRFTGGHWDNWSGIMGLQFENLVLRNRRLIWQRLQLADSDILMDGPFFQNKTQRQAGCQIDYLIQAKFGTFYLCEIKFSTKPLGSSILREVEAKRIALKMPKHCSIRPVLIHVNGVEDIVTEADYFAAVLDFSEFL